MPERLRIFISSPGDVLNERLRADLIIDKLAQDYGRLFAIESYRWEHEPLLASGHFQDAIEPPSAADILIMIVWSRLGTPLPERTAVREYRGLDGRAPVTGTEWEYEDALQAARARGAPDILAFRNVTPAAVDTRDPQARAESLRQLDALDAFWRRHFADRGVFLAAYDEYRTIEEFAARLEESLRKLIERRARARAAQPQAGASIWRGSPFRGLQTYEFEHATIFFGRDRLVTEGTEQLWSNARQGTAFLLVLGASGSGKSSLVRAALVPRLMRPQRIPGAAFLRHFTFRVGDGRKDLVAALVEGLTSGDADQKTGLPELLRPGQSVADCAAHLRGAVDASGFLFAGALGDLTLRDRERGRLLAHEEAKLVLVVDQLEEVFTSEDISDADRDLFLRLLLALARSGAIWVVATMRADFWPLALRTPVLVELAHGQGRIDVPPPGPAELSEIIRKPAQAAGLAFEHHEKTGLALDAVIAEDAASEPGVLPLLSFTLEALYQKDVAERGGHVLTHATYEDMGGLVGSIASRADEVLAGLPVDVQDVLPRVLRALTTLSGGPQQEPVARAAALDSFPNGTQARALVEALIAARLLVTSGPGESPYVRVAHEALISHWGHARLLLAADRRDLETRAIVERQEARWSDAQGPARKQLLLRDPDLANALDLARRWDDELDPATHAFIKESRRHARWRQRLLAAAAVIFGLVAIGAVVAAERAATERARAQRNYEAARAAVDGIVFNIAQELRELGGVRRETIARILETTRRMVDALSQSNPRDAAMQRLRASMLDEFAKTYQEFGDGPQALTAATESLAIFRKLLESEPTSRPRRRDLGVVLTRIGELKLAAGDMGAARSAFEEAHEVFSALAREGPEDNQAQRDLSGSLDSIARLQLRTGDGEGARKTYDESLRIMRLVVSRDPTNLRWQRDLALGLAQVGHLALQAGDVTTATALFDESLGVFRRIAQSDPDRAELQRDLSIALSRLGEIRIRGGDLDGALRLYDEALGIRRKLAQADAANTRWQRDVATSLSTIGTIHLRQNRLAEARRAFEEALAIARKLSAQDPESAEEKGRLAFALEQIGKLKRAIGDKDGARLAFREAAEILRGVVARDPENADMQQDLARTLGFLADLLNEVGDTSAAEVITAEQLELLRRLSSRSPNDSERAMDLSDGLITYGDVQRASGKHEAAYAAYAESVELLRKLASREGQRPDVRRRLAISLNRLGDVSASLGKNEEAARLYKESLALVRELLARSPTDAMAHADVFATVSRRVTLMRKLAQEAVESAAAQAELGFALQELALASANAGNLGQAATATEESLQIFRALSEREPENRRWRRGLIIALRYSGSLKLQAKDARAARELLEAELNELRALAAHDHADAELQGELGSRLGDFGDVQLALGEQARAGESYDASLSIARTRANADHSVQARIELVKALARQGHLAKLRGAASEARPYLQEALALAQALERSGELTGEQKTWPAGLQSALAELPG